MTCQFNLYNYHPLLTIMMCLKNVDRFLGSDLWPLVPDAGNESKIHIQTLFSNLFD